MDVVTLQTAKAYAVQGKAWANLPKGWDVGWRAAKAAQGTTPATVVVMGDSIPSGQGSTDWVTKGWPGALKAKLIAAGSTLYADHYPASTFGATQSSQAGTFPYTTFFSPIGTPEGGYGRCVITANTAAPAGVYTLPATATGFDIVYVDYATGTWTYQVDGGTATTVTTTGPGTQAGALVKKVSGTVTPGTTHTLAINAVTGSNVCLVQGVSVFYGTTGLGFVRNTYPGMKAADLLSQNGSNYGASNATSFPNDKIALWMGANSGASPSTGFGFPTAPALALVAFGVNDCNLGAPPKLFQLALKRMVLAFRRGNPNCSIVFVAHCNPEPGGLVTDTNIGGRGYDYQRYKTCMSSVASSYGAAWVDIDSKWGSTPLAKGFLPTSDVHPTDAGHDDIASTLAAIL